MNLKSSRIRSVEYNDSTEVLTIDFVKGGRYKYFKVPEMIFIGIVNSPSPGSYFDSYIKPMYPCKKS